jgi:hypothetical protein
MKAIAICAMCAGFLIAMTGASARADQKKHEEKFCSALNDFHKDLKNMQSLGQDATLQQLQDASNLVSNDADKLIKEGGKIKSPTAKQFKSNAAQLRSESQALPANLTVAQAQDRLSADVQNVKQSARQLASESGCPMPKEEPKGRSSASESQSQ